MAETSSQFSSLYCFDQHLKKEQVVFFFLSNEEQDEAGAGCSPICSLWPNHPPILVFGQSAIECWNSSRFLLIQSPKILQLESLCLSVPGLWPCLIGVASTKKEKENAHTADSTLQRFRQAGMHLQSMNAITKEWELCKILLAKTKSKTTAGQMGMGRRFLLDEIGPSSSSLSSWRSSWNGSVFLDSARSLNFTASSASSSASHASRGKPNLPIQLIL